MSKSAIVLAIGLEDSVQGLVDQALPEAQKKKVSAKPDFETCLDQPPTGVELIICGPTIKELAAGELAQATRGVFSAIPILYATTLKEGFDKASLLKNGFSEAFFLPLEKKMFAEACQNALNPTAQVFKPVKVIDLEANSKLDFGVKVFLPQNKKFLTFLSAGDTLGAERQDRLKQHGVGSLFVEKGEMSKFYDYTAQRLAETGKSGTLSATQKKEKLESSVRNLFTALVDISVSSATVERGRELMTDLQNIVKTFILKSEPSDWYSKISQVANDTSEDYSHPKNVSTLAALFSMGLQLGKPEEMATAGLFHDLGLTDVPVTVLDKPEASWTEEERKVYQRHPEYSVDILKNRKVALPQNVVTAILRHHERWDGKGYPKGMAGNVVGVEGQLLSLADQFDYLNRIEPGKKSLTPREALIKIQESGSIDPELVKKVLRLFPS